MKAAAGRAAVDALVKSGMKLGLGTGSTAIHAVRRIGELLTSGRLTDIAAFATSMQTEIECERLGIPVYGLNSKVLSGSLDLAIDGADEVDPAGNLIKGGGAALLVEKIAAYASRAFAVVIDEGKLVAHMGTAFPVPVEVIPEARLTATLAIQALGGKAVLREAKRKVGPVITEHGNLILDILFAVPVDPRLMESELNRIPGIVENGFFTLRPPAVFVGHADGTVVQSP
ncbi:MAG: ribose-5-phosphate isomerase RpiA [Treponema sp.]|nr:ribose-5-phosphate isomerase RpiA [Treponema sp.]